MKHNCNNALVSQLRSVMFWMSLCFVSLQSCVGSENCTLYGSWRITKGRLFENYEAAAQYTTNRVTFYQDTIELASGFFYNTLGPNDDYPNGRFPFIYYGNKEKYKVEGEVLRIFSKPYNSWSTFEIMCVTENQIRLLNTVNTDTVLLERLHDKSDAVCEIKTIKAQVYKSPVDQFNIGYKVTLTDNDVMLYEQQDSVGEKFSKKNFNLKAGTFKDICKAFNYVDVERLKPIYVASESDYKLVKVEIELMNGKTVKVEAQDLINAPQEFQIALMPVLYLHQQFIYPPLPAKKW